MILATFLYGTWVLDCGFCKVKLILLTILLQNELLEAITVTLTQLCHIQRYQGTRAMLSLVNGSPVSFSLTWSVRQSGKDGKRCFENLNAKNGLYSVHDDKSRLDDYDDYAKVDLTDLSLIGILELFKLSETMQLEILYEEIHDFACQTVKIFKTGL